MDERSVANMKGVHQDLQDVMQLAWDISKVKFVITEGLRTLERQKKLFASGASKTLNSRHLTGHAVDIAFVIDKTLRWDWPLFRAASVDIKNAAHGMGVPIVWGGDWPTFKDGPHFELDRKKYPA